MDEDKTAIAPAGIDVEIPAPDFEIKSCIGEGAFGRVFLALSKATGRYRAIKVVRRTGFQGDRPYEIEFAGLKRFEEVSREHEGFVDILHVTRDDRAGYFSYVMELADDLESAQQIDEAHYIPRTLGKELERRRCLPPAECVRVGLALTAALGELHRRGLVHRDVNPRNIVFVRGAPKLADVGLVTEAQSTPHTLIGTPDYMDPAVHGAPAGDLYSFGKVLYAMATGLHPRHWPDRADGLDKSPDWPVLRELEAIWRKACEGNPKKRYQDAAEIYKELLALQAGTSALRLKRFERTVEFVRSYGPLLLVGLISVAVGLYYRAKQQGQAAELQQRKVGSFVSNGNHALDSADPLAALSWFAEAWRLDSRSENELVHRVRLGSVLQQAPALKQLWFQERPIKEAFFAGQINQVVMSDTNGQWQVYDLWSGESLHKPFGVGLPGEKVSLSSRTAMAVTAAETNSIWLWDYQTGAQLRELRRPDSVMTQAAISQDGTWIAATANTPEGEESLLLWKNVTEPGEPIVLERRPVLTRCLTFSPNSRLLLSCSDQQARVWDVEAGQLVSTFTNHHNVVFSGSFSPDSRSAVTASFDRSARIWDAQTARELARFTHDDAVFAAEFDSGGTRLVTAGLDFAVHIWDVATQANLQILRHNSKVLRAGFSPQDRFLLTSCFDDTVRVWHLPKPRRPTAVAGLLTCGGLRTLVQTNQLWSLRDGAGELLQSLTQSNDLEVTFRFAPDDRFFVTVCPADAEPSADLRVRLFDAQTARESRGSIAVPRGYTNLTVSPGGQWLLASNGETADVWNTSSGQRLGSISNGCKRGAFSPNGKLLAVSRANHVQVLDLENNLAPLGRWSHPPNSEVSAMDWDSASRRLVTSCWNSTFTPLEAQIWMAQTGEPVGRPLAHRDGVLYATFSHGGRFAITCGEDFNAILWNASTGRQLAPPMRHHDQVFYAAFSEDDRLVATAAVNDTITVWAADSGEPLTSLSLPLFHSALGVCIRFTPDNQALMIRDGRGHSFLWKLPYYDRPLKDLLLIGQLLSAQQTDSTETLMPHPKEALRSLWQQLRSKYPTDFSLPVE